jgi:glyoxylase-like metal-dependent hydrolase (beta-lactamase superfamily II)
MADIVLHREPGTGTTRYVAPEVSYLHDKFVNVIFVGAPGAPDREWTLIDAGLPGSADKIKRAAAELLARARGQRRSCSRTDTWITWVRFIPSRAIGTCRCTRTRWSCPT